MASLSNYGALQFHLEQVDGSGTIPTTYYAGLYTTGPALDGTGGVEVPVNAWYTARIAAVLDTASARTLTNTSAVTFTASATAVVANPVTHVVITDSATLGAGNIWYSFPLTSALSIGMGTPVIFPAGQLVHEFLST